MLTPQQVADAESAVSETAREYGFAYVSRFYADELWPHQEVHPIELFGNALHVARGGRTTLPSHLSQREKIDDFCERHQLREVPHPRHLMFVRRTP